MGGGIGGNAVSGVLDAGHPRLAYLPGNLQAGSPCRFPLTFRSRGERAHIATEEDYNALSKPQGNKLSSNLLKIGLSG